VRLGAPRHRRGLLASLVAMVLCISAAATTFYMVHPVQGAPRGSQRVELAVKGQQPGSATPGTNSTSIWSASAGALSLGGGAGPGVKAPGSAGLPVTTQPQPSGAPTSGVDVSPAPFAPWPPRNPWMAVPGHSAFAVSGPPGNFYSWAFGQCTWWAQWERRAENLMHMGNAQNWAGVAATRGYTISSHPRPNATVVFQPGVQGAGGAGHVAHVVAVYPGGWFLVSEMNFYWNGGGLARVDYRYVHSGWGVQFIY
jgi:surface antigen